MSVKKLGLKPVPGSERTVAIQPNLAMHLFLGSCSYDLFSKFCTTVCKEDERFAEEDMRTAHSSVSGVNSTVAKSIPFTQYFHLHLLPQACILVLIWMDSLASLWEIDFQSSLLSSSTTCISDFYLTFLKHPVGLWPFSRALTNNTFPSLLSAALTSSATCKHYWPRCYDLL